MKVRLYAAVDKFYQPFGVRYKELSNGALLKKGITSWSTGVLDNLLQRG